ncbi:hypothetical protein MRB53_038203 [Persea americana]|nr:hypothetical protein MRB53_038203 [Persea americana]
MRGAKSLHHCFVDQGRSIRPLNDHASENATWRSAATMDRLNMTWTLPEASDWVLASAEGTTQSIHSSHADYARLPKHAGEALPDGAADKPVRSPSHGRCQRSFQAQRDAMLHARSYSAARRLGNRRIGTHGAFLMRKACFAKARR